MLILPVSIGFDVDFNDGTSVYTPSSATTTGSEGYRNMG